MNLKKKFELIQKTQGKLVDTKNKVLERCGEYTLGKVQNQIIEEKSEENSIIKESAREKEPKKIPSQNIRENERGSQFAKKSSKQIVTIW